MPRKLKVKSTASGLGNSSSGVDHQSPNPFMSPISPTNIQPEWSAVSLYDDAASSSAHSNSHSIASQISSTLPHRRGSPESIPAAGGQPGISPIARRAMNTTTPTPVASPVSPNPRAPPSAFRNDPSFYPFQAYPGVPDPVPRRGFNSRRSSSESLLEKPLVMSPTYPHATERDAMLQDNSIPMPTLRSSAFSAEMPQEDALPAPRAPFMAENRRDSSGSLSSLDSNQGTAVYRNSAAAVQGASTPPRPPSTVPLRAPFLSPSSRPSSVWSPPTPVITMSPNASSTYLGSNSTKFVKPPARSTRLDQKLTKTEKPWLAQRQQGERSSWWITFSCFWIGIAASAFLCYRTVVNAKVIPERKLCMVMDDEFNGDSLNTDQFWNYQVELGGFGNGEFQATTKDSKNVFLRDGQLYIHPTLTTDDLSDPNQIFDGGSLDFGNDCTTKNRTACAVKSKASTKTVLNPVKSGRIHTQNKVSIAYGKVEVKAKLPKGDWLWPAIWMLPNDDSKYGAWPVGGEIDIMEARGNGINYPQQGYNFVRSSMNYGPFNALVRTLTGWKGKKLSNYADDFHIYGLEWDQKFIRAYVDSRLTSMLDLDVGTGWWDRAGFPPTARNNTQTEVVVSNPYLDKGGTPGAPFDQQFYLIIDLAVGGTSGWFPDTFGNKSWFDAAATPMTDFARAQQSWSSTWPSDDNERSFRIDYVKMWKFC